VVLDRRNDALKLFFGGGESDAEILGLASYLHQGRRNRLGAGRHRVAPLFLH
jgi:hypothetical protein